MPQTYIETVSPRGLNSFFLPDKVSVIFIFAAFYERYGHLRDALSPPDIPDPVIRGSLDADVFHFDTENMAQVVPHVVEIFPESRPFRNNRGIDIDRFVAAFFQLFHHLLD